MSESFESVRWNACVHRLDLGLYSHPEEYLGNGVRTHANCKGKIPSTRGSEEDRSVHMNESQDEAGWVEMQETGILEVTKKPKSVGLI